MNENIIKYIEKKLKIFYDRMNFELNELSNDILENEELKMTDKVAILDCIIKLHISTCITNHLLLTCDLKDALKENLDLDL